jgi:hypothetical protein
VNVAPRHLTAEAETLLSATLIHEVSWLVCVYIYIYIYIEIRQVLEVVFFTNQQVFIFSRLCMFLVLIPMPLLILGMRGKDGVVR